MSNVVLGYPVISESDYDWVQGLRKIHDKLYQVVKPHFTFVFPTAKLSETELIKHTELKSADVHKIAITLSKAIVVEDDSKTFFHTFLIPLEGENEIVELHDLLYSDDLASELRLDIPFIPHVGVGTGDANSMQKLADKINANSINIVGSIEALTVASYDGKIVNDVKKVQLRS